MDLHFYLWLLMSACAVALLIVNRRKQKVIDNYKSLLQKYDDGWYKTDVTVKDERTSDFETVILPHFFSSFAQAALMTIHIKMLDGNDTHHIIEAVFKSFARALKIAVSIDNDKKDIIPSTKGVL